MLAHTGVSYSFVQAHPENLINNGGKKTLVFGKVDAYALVHEHWIPDQLSKVRFQQYQQMTRPNRPDAP